jgi:uncharacterized C2H2 Zn-finger protein
MPESAAVAQTATAEARPYVCDECGQQFTRQQGLTRHMRETHGGKKEKPKEQTTDRLHARLAAFAQPLLDERAEIQRELERAQERVNDLRLEVRSYDAALKRIDPSLVRAKASAGQGKTHDRPFDPDSEADAKKIAAVEQYLGAHDELDEGFTVTGLADRMQAIGSGISGHKMRKIIELLHARGVVRKDRVVKGGGYAYVLIGRNGDGAQ